MRPLSFGGMLVRCGTSAENVARTKGVVSDR
jgi:hypothetical protein